MQGVVPELSDVELGELALNTADGKIFTKVDDGTESIVELGGGGASELEKIIEGGNTGWRLLGRDPDEYGDIGRNAVDLAINYASGNYMGATGGGSFAFGYDTTASGYGSFASGYTTVASGDYSHAEGVGYSGYENATGYASHTEGYYSTASGSCSHCEGSNGEASGDSSHSEGKNGDASGPYSHAEGYGCEASSRSAHAEGERTTASGEASHAEGLSTIAQNSGSHAAGIYNVGTSPDTIHETGIGTSPSARVNAFEIHGDGKIVMPNLPIADPVLAGALWNDSGVLKISAG